MPARELLAKTVAFVVAAGSCIAAGVLVLTGPHAYNDYFNTGTGWGLIVFGVGIGGIGAVVIAGILVDARIQQRERRLRVTPRPGPLEAPPAWGMGDVGRIDKIMAADADIARGPHRGGGSVRVMSASMIHWDVPLVIGAAFIWTALMTLWLAPH
jgi:hypothetical protein